ncbi:MULTISPECIES: hypothetical protein [unclassified Microcoleus]|nr:MULTISPECIES: hypothetical protein [unclassified Microcoleus]
MSRIPIIKWVLQSDSLWRKRKNASEERWNREGAKDTKEDGR